MSADTDKAGPEHQEKHRVSQWLQEWGGDVWWEEANPWGYDLFRIRRGDEYVSSKPDLVVEIGNLVFVVEFKPSISTSSVYDSMTQLHGYWMSHSVHEQQYVCDGRGKSIDGFVTATGNSIVGHLFEADVEQVGTKADFSESRCRAIERGQLPAREYNMTEQHIRSLYRLRDKAANNAGVTGGPAVGSLLSTALDGDRDPKPALLWKGENGENWRVLA
jgi:hypothetical protein